MHALKVLTFGREARTGTRLVAIWLMTLMVLGCVLMLTEKASPRQVGGNPPTGKVEAIRPQILDTYGRLPLSFEANRGQTDAQVQFLARGRGYTLFLTSTEVRLALQQAMAPVGPFSLVQQARPDMTERAEPTLIRMQLLGANSSPRIEGLHELPGKSHYYIGNDPGKWHTNVPSFARVAYQDVYPGVDMVFYGNQQQLEYDFILAPDADPGAIAFAFHGVDEMEIDDRGNLVLHTAGGKLVQRAPVVYQEVDGSRETIPGDYVLKGEHEVGFQLGSYDASQPLIIDPVLIYSTYHGVAAEEMGHGIAVDAAGNVYVAGSAGSVVAGKWMGDAFVTKLDPTGTLSYTTHFGGDLEDYTSGIAVDSAGNAYATGTTYSDNFPTQNALQPTHGNDCDGYYCGDAFVVQLDEAGETIYATFLGGSGAEFGEGIAVDAAGDVYVTGDSASPNFPISENAYQSAREADSPADGFVTKLDPSQLPENQLLYSTCLGGSAGDSPESITVDDVGNAYVAGSTSSIDFPTTPNAIQSDWGGDWDAFVTKLNVTGSDLIYSTYLGGIARDYGNGITVDAAGNAYVAGSTSSIDFPTTPNAIQSDWGGDWDAFVTKLNVTGSDLIYSTYLGGIAGDSGESITVDTAGNAFVTGWTMAADFPVANALQPAFGGSGYFNWGDAFIAKVNPDGSDLRYATYFGGSSDDAGFGIALDAAGNAYVTGLTASAPDFPLSNAWQPTHGGGAAWGLDAFIAKIAHPSYRALYVWRDPNPQRNGTPINYVEAQRLADFAVDRSIDTIYYDNWGCGEPNGSCESGSGAERQDVTTLALIIGELHDHGLRVEALYTDNTRVSDVVAYNNTVSARERFDGIRLNIEYPDFPSGEWEPTLPEDLDLYSDAVAVAGSLPVFVSISHHWDEPIIYGGETKAAYEHILDIVAGVDVQTVWETKAEVVNRAQEEVCYGNELGKPVHLTIETYDVESNIDGLDARHTFFEEGEDAMHTELANPTSASACDPVPNGYAYHFYRQSIGSSTLPRWAPDLDGDFIADPVDVAPLGASDYFSDVGLGGGTFGEIIERGNQTFVVADHPDSNEGVLITSAHYGGVISGTVSVCDEAASIAFNAGAGIEVTCGSVTIGVTSGVADITLMAADGTEATLALNEDNRITFEPETLTITTPETNPDPVDVVIGGAMFSVDPGESEPIVPVQIDVKPGSYPNSFNINGHGMIPVAILGSESLDVTQLDPASMEFSGLEVRVKGNGVPQCSVEDVTGADMPFGAADGYPDMVCQFVDKPDGWIAGSDVGTLRARFFDGRDFVVTDEINVVP